MVNSKCYGCESVTRTRSGYCSKCVAERRALYALADARGWVVQVSALEPVYVQDAKGERLSEGATALDALRNATGLSEPNRG